VILKRIKSSQVLWALALVVFLSATGCGTDGPSSEAPVAEDEAAPAAGSAESAESTASEGVEGEEGVEAEASRRETSTTVSTALVMRRDLVLPVKAEGRVRARHTSDVKFERAGRIDRIYVREGQRVSKGQVLVRLDDRELRLSLEEAMSRYLQGLGQLAVEEDGYREGEHAERTLDQQRAELERRERAGEITREQRLDLELELGMDAVRDGAYRRELLEVRSGVAAARAEAARLQIELERTEVRAPFAGVISALDLNQGENVQVGQVFCRLVDDINVEAAVGVLESDLSVVTVGKPALLEVPALRQSIPLQVDVIDPEVATDSRTCRVLLRLRSDEQRVKPGMFVRAWIAGEVLPDRLLVPREAIVTRDGRPVLFKVEGDRALWVYVQLGRQNAQLVEITRIDQGGPLEPGTQVIVSNHLTMTHEAKVKVKETIEVPDLWGAAVEGSEGE
jgi:membrane fusion protein (multidrug efflux system)